MLSTKLNESFYQISGIPEQLKEIKRKLTIKDPKAFFDPMVKRGFKSDSEVFYIESNGDLIVPSGLVPFLKNFNIQYYNEPEYNESEILDFLDTLNLPFEMYDYQKTAIIESIINKQQLCLAATGAGKSVIIFGIVSFLLSKGIKGLILVPSISLTTQLFNDFKDYNATDDFLENILLIGGDNNIKSLDYNLTISTWQSAMRIESGFDTLGFVIVDECHGLKLDSKSTDIVYKAINAKYRIGLTGTLPDDDIAKMSVLSCVGVPKRYVSTQGLIERGLATPVVINVIKLRYNHNDQSIFKHAGDHAKRLMFIKEHINRNKLLAKFSLLVRDTGNTVVMCSHTQHMKDIYTGIMELLHPEIQITEKDITGAKSFEFQDNYKVYYIAGVTKVKDREKILNILRDNTNVILISNFQLFSTGLNIKSLKNILFASPLKSYTTITQSIGRAIRTHVSKEVANIYDFVDDLSVRGNSGPFYKQYQERLAKSYNPEGFPVFERIIQI